MTWFSVFPIATVSSAAFYVFMGLLLVPALRPKLAAAFVHPIPPQQEYLRGFDTVRGLAACLVAIGHCWWATYPVFASTQLSAHWIAYASKGVPIFAVLSGFLIYRSVLSIDSLPDLRKYAVRRFFRIYPVYLFAVLCCLVTGQYAGSQHYSALGFLASDVFMFPIFSWPGGYANPPTWSLYIEAAFYAFLPVTVIAVGRHRMLALAALGLAAMIVADYPSRVFVLWRYFLIGIIASELSPRVGRLAPILFIAGVALLAVDLRAPSGDIFARMGVGRTQADGASIGLGLACGLILASLPHLPRTGRALNVLPLKIIGVISYSVYIIQFFYILASFPLIGRFSQAGTAPMYEQMKALPAAPTWYLPLVFFPGVITWGAICFLLVERPGIKLGQRIVRRVNKETSK